jgi:tetratricopeptide (TPR) repeat protein
MPPRKVFLAAAFATTFVFPAGAIGKTKQLASSYVAAGDQFRQNGRYKDAIDQYSKAIKADKRNPRYYQYRADCELSLSNYKKAVSDTTKSIKLNPGDPDAFSMRARAFDQLKEYQKEKSDLDRLVSLQPSGTNILQRARVEARLKEYKYTINDCDQAINMGLARNDLSDLYQLRADSYKKLGKKREYEQELAKYNSLQP